MEHNIIIEGTFFALLFLFITGVFQIISSKWSSVPYTAALILAGFATRFTCQYFGIPVSLTLSPDLIYYVLLPLLLFESSYHISAHHFKLQFHTINALATIGLLISVAVVTLMLVAFTNLSTNEALLFAAIISSTDPISVISLFKQLGAPRRLALIADGESMLNDATSVIVFKIVAGIVLVGSGFNSNFLFTNVLSFFSIFVGSIVFGAFLGILSAALVSRLGENLIAMNMIALVSAIFGFASAEHMFSLSGVITCVSYGVVFGNIIVPKFNHHREAAFHHFWEFIALISVSVVFFFSSFTLELGGLTASSQLWLPVVFAVLVGRAASVYLVCAATNKFPLFKYEPKIPLSWQHVLNWGGLRGVIPLVLAYSLPLSFEGRGLMIALTMTCFLFTLLVNGFTIKPLLLFLGLHRPHAIEELYGVQKKIINLRSQKLKLDRLNRKEFDQKIIDQQYQELKLEEGKFVGQIASHSDYSVIYRSFRMAGNKIEREATKELFDKGYMDEEVLYAFETQLNQQLDRIEYPDLPHRNIKKVVDFDTSTCWRNRIADALRMSASNQLLKWIFGSDKESLIRNRLSLLQVRLITSYKAVQYFNELKDSLYDSRLCLNAISEIILEQKIYIKKNRDEIVSLRVMFPEIHENLQKHLLLAVLKDDDLDNLTELEFDFDNETSNDFDSCLETNKVTAVA